MLSVIILCAPHDLSPAGASAEAVVRTLSALVGACVRGLVRDVVLAGPSRTELAVIADHAGCSFVEAASEAELLRNALALVRGEDVLILRPGHIPETGFVEEIEDLLADGRLRGGRRIYAAPASYWQRLIPALTPVVGLLAPVRACRAAKDAPTLSLAALLQATGSRAALRARAKRVS